MINYEDWPDCAIKGCKNKSCLRLESKYCWPHTPGTPSEALDNISETEVIEREIESTLPI